jgi:hypothetical protein
MRHFLLLVSVWAAVAQSITIGVTGGGRVTDDMSGEATSESKRYVVGPAFELGLPLGLGVEVDALYRCDGYRSLWGNWAGTSFDRARFNSWEFPMLLTYRVPAPAVKPFAEVGYAPRVGSGTVDSNLLVLFPTQSYQQVHYSAAWQTSYGLVVGGGVRFGLGRLRLSPQVRYTHWNNAAVSGYYSDGPSYQSTQNQVDVLLGIGWKVR